MPTRSARAQWCFRSSHPVYRKCWLHPVSGERTPPSLTLRSLACLVEGQSSKTRLGHIWARPGESCALRNQPPTHLFRNSHETLASCSPYQSAVLHLFDLAIFLNVHHTVMQGWPFKNCWVSSGAIIGECTIGFAKTAGIVGGLHLGRA